MYLCEQTQLEASNRRIAELETLVCEKDRCLTLYVEEARGRDDEVGVVSWCYFRLLREGVGR